MSPFWKFFIISNFVFILQAQYALEKGPDYWGEIIYAVAILGFFALFSWLASLLFPDKEDK